MDYMLKERFMNRINSDRADSTSVSMILWIVFTVVLVITVGHIIFAHVYGEGITVGNCIDNSNTEFPGKSFNAQCGGSYTTH
jgi:hypothetical protein